VIEKWCIGRYFRFDDKGTLKRIDNPVGGMMLILRPRVRGLFLLVLLILFPRSVMGGIASAYHLVPLGSLGQSNYAYHINDNGDIVGAYYASNDPNDYHSFLYRSGQMIDLFPGERSRAHGINNAGTVVGFGTATDSRAWTYSNGVRTSIPGLGGAFAQGITDDGVVVGYSLFGGRYHPFTYDGHVVRDLGLPDGAFSAQGYGINKGGDVVGLASRGGLNVPVLYSGGTWSYLAEDYPYGGWAFAINDLGTITGFVYPKNGQTQAMRISNGVVSLLGKGANTYGNGINEEGIIVGDNGTTAFIDDGVSNFNLNTLLEPGTGWYLSGANDINEKGEIVGWGVDSQGNQRAYLLEPLVPEPHGLLIITLATPFWGARCFRRRGSRGLGRG
jgi:probable HAF family extracellular repeat protein